MRNHDNPSNTENPGPDQDALFHLLSDELRRYALRYLSAANDEAVHEDQLMDYVAEKTGRPRWKVQRRMHHQHLPKLEKQGVIEYDRRTGEMRYDEPPLDEVKKFLEELEDL